jgi:hypothetical protein
MDLQIDDTKTSLRQILESWPGGAKQMILQAAFEALGARRGWNQKGQSEVQWEPDYRTRLDAARFLAAYVEGLPIQTSVQVAVGDQPGAAMSLEEAASRSPALRDRLLKLVGPSTT